MVQCLFFTHDGLILGSKGHRSRSHDSKVVPGTDCILNVVNGLTAGWTYRSELCQSDFGSWQLYRSVRRQAARLRSVCHTYVRPSAATYVVVRLLGFFCYVVSSFLSCIYTILTQLNAEHVSPSER